MLLRRSDPLLLTILCCYQNSCSQEIFVSSTGQREMLVGQTFLKVCVKLKEYAPKAAILVRLYAQVW